MPNYKKLMDEATNVLAMNNRGAYTQPAHTIYPHQWLWDSCFIAIGMRHLDVERAQTELLSLLRGQWQNGMLPNIIFRDDARYHSDRSIWRSWLNPNAPHDVATTGITQPPMLAEAVVQIGKKLKAPERRSWYKKIYPALLAYHEWLYAERDPRNEGLVLQIHPWETGLDSTPPWINEMHTHQIPMWINVIAKTHFDSLINHFRRDTRSIPLDQRFSTIEALCLFDAQRRLRRKNYEIDRILDRSLFAIEDLSFNSILIRANQHLQTIAKSIHTEIPMDLLRDMHATEKALEQLWDEYAGQYFSRDFMTHRLLKIPTIATLLPLYAGSITPARAKKLVALLEQEHGFGPAYPIPSVPLDSSWFNSKLYWQGPTWVNSNWLVIDGLKRYGFNEHAAALTESTLEMIQTSGCYEYFDPVNGEAAGAANFSWTAALAIDLATQ